MATIIDVTADHFDEEVRTRSGLVLLDLWAPWCGPCRTLGATITKLAPDWPDNVTVAKLNCDEAPELANEFGVKGLPTLVLLRQGNEVARQTGAIHGAGLTDWIEAHS